MKLVWPNLKYRKTFLETLEMTCEKEKRYFLNPFKEPIHDDFSDFVKETLDLRDEKNNSDGIARSIFWVEENNQIIGRVSIKHKLNKKLKKVGGNISYITRVDQRNKGYGKKIFKLALKQAKKIGLKEVWITCKSDNIYSQKIIESNGGKIIKKTKIRYYYIIKL